MIVMRNSHRQHETRAKDPQVTVMHHYVQMPKKKEKKKENIASKPASVPGLVAAENME